MTGIKDRIMLGVVAGIAGNAAKTVLNEISLRKKLAKRAYRMTAASIFLPNYKDAKTISGQVLGTIIDFGSGILGGVGIVHLLSKTGRDQIVTKGILSGMTFGTLLSATVFNLPHTKVERKDPESNLSNMGCHVLYGIVTTFIAAKLGHPSLFDTKPLNNYLKPSELTTEQKRNNYRKQVKG